MALIRCPGCSAAISDRAQMCPVCGYLFELPAAHKRESRPSKIIIVGVVLFVVGTLVLWLNPGLRTRRAPAPAEAMQPQAETGARPSAASALTADGCTSPPIEIFTVGTMVLAADFEDRLRASCGWVTFKGDDAIVRHEGRRYRVSTTLIPQNNNLRLRRIDSIQAE